MNRLISRFFAGLLFSASLVVTSIAADPVPRSNPDAQAMMNSFLAQEAARLEANFFEGITNRTQWEGQRETFRREYLEMLGLWPMPERTPLQAQITGVLERDEGFRIEKLHFQSRPGLYVTGNLYLPRTAKAGDKLPAVLYLCGHADRGRDGNKSAYQHHGVWFATHGYACLLIDTLQLGEIAAIHHGTRRFNRWWWQARGYTPAGIECWNGLRALDYLQGRPELDPERIAVTGRSGGGAATFWIAAADDRVKVAVPVSGMSDLEDHVGAKVVNGHCDCMFHINTYQWPFARIAGLIVPRPMLFENSGHDTIFPMNGNDRIRARLEKLYGFYTNRTDQLFDIGVVPGGHQDQPELRLMAYRWINRFLKNDNSPVTEPQLPPIDGAALRVFPGAFPSDELNTRIDELFVPAATNTLPASAGEFQTWKASRLAELRRIVFRGLPARFASQPSLNLTERGPVSGTIPTEPGIEIPWRHFPASARNAGTPLWLVVLDENESMETKPDWVAKVIGDDGALVIAPRGSGPMRWEDPAPYYIRRSLPLLGRSVDDCRLADVLAAAASMPGPRPVKIIGRGNAGVIAAYAALLDPRLSEVVVVDPPASHREGPIFLNVLRVLDVPEALGMLAPRPLTIHAANPEMFKAAAAIYRASGEQLKLRPVE